MNWAKNYSPIRHTLRITPCVFEHSKYMCLMHRLIDASSYSGKLFWMYLNITYVKSKSLRLHLNLNQSIFCNSIVNCRNLNKSSYLTTFFLVPISICSIIIYMYEVIQNFIVPVALVSLKDPTFQNREP